MASRHPLIMLGTLLGLGVGLLLGGCAPDLVFMGRHDDPRLSVRENGIAYQEAYLSYLFDNPCTRLTFEACWSRRMIEIACRHKLPSCPSGDPIRDRTIMATSRYDNPPVAHPHTVVCSSGRFGYYGRQYAVTCR